MMTSPGRILESIQIAIASMITPKTFETLLIQPAIETVNPWLIIDRLNESAYRRLMRLHFLNGDRSAALQAYETCLTLLTDELGVAPASETLALLEHIRTSPSQVSVADTESESLRTHRTA